MQKRLQYVFSAARQHRYARTPFRLLTSDNRSCHTRIVAFYIPPCSTHPSTDRNSKTTARTLTEEEWNFSIFLFFHARIVTKLTLLQERSLCAAAAAAFNSAYTRKREGRTCGIFVSFPSVGSSCPDRHFFAPVSFPSPLPFLSPVRGHRGRKRRHFHPVWKC